MTGRQALITELRDHLPWDAQEAALVDRMTAFVEREPDCFLRSLIIGHLTASAWILSPGMDQVLFLHHRKLDKWLQPGGHADGVEDLRIVAATEVREETGLDLQPFSPTIFDVDIHTIPARPDEPEHEHFDVRFLFVADPALPLLVNHESRGLKWIPVAEIPAYNSETSILRMMDKTLTIV